MATVLMHVRRLSGCCLVCGEMLKIVPYQKSWPVEFSMLAGTLRRALGDLALRIDHIGSTSVAGLAAKDIIDIQVTVSQLDQAVEQALKGAGYTRHETILQDHIPPGSTGSADDWIKWLFKPPEGQRPTNLHVRLAGHHNQRYALLFRDYLRTHPATARAYAELKLRLAEHLADPQMYPQVKDPAVDLIYLAAQEWAQAIGWEPGPTDC
jgi:GrpB-like predicted nucleotidyltransferase (UPF0157 family)